MPIVTLVLQAALPDLDAWRAWAFEAFIVVYCFALGATVGSFLNVVVYRMPRNLNVVRPRSRCPACETPIALRDNIPVYSWLALGGRCRSCACRISARYMVVEALMGGLFVALFYLEVRSGGGNLPLHEARPVRNILILHWSTLWDVVRLACYHFAMLAFLLACVLIRWDGLAVPRRLIVAGTLLGLLLPLVWPNLRPVPWSTDHPDPAHLVRSWQDGLFDGLLGLCGGLMMGQLLAMATAGPGQPERFCAMRGMMLLSGVFLGWQAALSITLLTMVALLPLLLVRRVLEVDRHWPMETGAALAVLGQIVFWRTLDRLGWWPGTHSSAAGMLAALMVVVALAGAIRLLLPDGEEEY